MKTINWGIIGCGDVTEKKSGPALQKIEHSNLVAVMRRQGDKAKDYAERHGVPKWYGVATDLINDPEVNAIYIATPPDSHLLYTVMAAEAGKPIYVEKPMGRNFEECEKMNKVCTKANVPLYVAYYRRALEKFLKVEELLKSNAIGEVRFVNIQHYKPIAPAFKNKSDLPWRVQPEISGGGLIFDLGSHQLDILDYLLGPIDDAQGKTSNQAGLYSAEDTVCANFRFKSGVLGSGIWCFSTPKHCAKEQTEIIGSHGRIVYSCFDNVSDIFFLENEEGVETFEIPWPEHVQQPLLQTIVDELRGEGNCPSSGTSGSRTSYVLDQIVNES